MKKFRLTSVGVKVCLGASLYAVAALSLKAADPAAPVITNIITSGNTRSLRFDQYPAAGAYSILSATNPAQALSPNTNFVLSPYIISASTNGTNFGYEWRATNAVGVKEFYRLGVTPLSSNALLTAQVLNRLAYGPTPDEVVRVAAIGPQAYIDEQLAPWNLTEDVGSAHTNIPFIEAKFCNQTNFVTTNNASLADFRAWHVLRAVNARRQLLEILLQFWENHFVTQESKSDNYMGGFYDDNPLEERISVQYEQLENEQWRNALLNPQCTFYDLLKISAESPAMIIYLDTVTSRGDGSRVANENYARELLELFTFGVDNGYDQNDITVMSRAWSGWTIKKVDFTNAFNPFAPQTTVIIPGSTNTSTTTISNLYGVWAFSYDSTHHNNSNKVVFPGKTVPARFGSPWAGLNYQLTLTNGSGTNSIQDGYQVLTHLCNQPFTEEYLSIKLCRLLVHDDFPNPSNDPTLTNEYAFYNYAAGNLSPEAQLVHDCMMAWETNSPKGQVWKVLKVITDSDLFRSHQGVSQKVKTPLEFAVSTIRALRSGSNGTYTASTDGYSISGTSASGSCILTRAGNMLLFDRDAPDGYPEAGAPWISAGTLTERVRFAQSFSIALGQNGHTGTFGSTNNDAGNCISSPVDLLTRYLPATSQTNATAVADYFVNTLFPGEGAGNLQLYRDAVVSFLNDGTADTTTANTNKLFGALPVSNNATNSYDQRVRGAVGLLLGTQRFQEQ